MKASHLRSISFYQRKRESLLYRAMSLQGPVFIKCLQSKDPGLRRALSDEYHVMHTLSHPGIPAYYGMFEDFPLPDREGHALALCMQDCLKLPQLNLADLAWPDLIETLSQICGILSYLLENGVLYTDLNPTNILLHYDKKIQVSLVDYSCCYFFLENPNPDYSLRFSYNLSPNLKGQQLLIQEMSFLLQELIDQRTDSQVPSSLYRLLEAGKNPPDYLSLSEYASMIEETRP